MHNSHTQTIDSIMCTIVVFSSHNHKSHKGLSGYLTSHVCHAETLKQFEFKLIQTLAVLLMSLMSSLFFHV